MGGLIDGNGIVMRLSKQGYEWGLLHLAQKQQGPGRKIWSKSAWGLWKWLWQLWLFVSSQWLPYHFCLVYKSKCAFFSLVTAALSEAFKAKIQRQFEHNKGDLIPLSCSSKPLCPSEIWVDLKQKLIEKRCVISNIIVGYLSPTHFSHGLSLSH